MTTDRLSAITVPRVAGNGTMTERIQPNRALGAELLMSGIPGITRGKRSKHGIPKVFEIEKVRGYFDKLNEKIDEAQSA